MLPCLSAGQATQTGLANWRAEGPGPQVPTAKLADQNVTSGRMWQHKQARRPIQVGQASQPAAENTVGLKGPPFLLPLHFCKRETAIYIYMYNTNVLKLQRVWRHARLSIQRKLSCGLSTACLTQTDRRSLDGFHARCLRKLLRIAPSYFSRVSNEADEPANIASTVFVLWKVCKEGRT